jgi:hypothetical protein
MDAVTIDRPDLDAVPVDTGRVPPAEPDQDAPYGRKDDGTPRRSAGGRPRKSTGGGAPRAPRARPASSGGGRARPSTRYAEQGAGLLHMGGALAGVINPVDGIILDAYAEPFGKALQRAAEEHPALARFLDSIGGGSSLIELAVMSATVLGLVAANHGLLKGNPLEPMLTAQVAELVARKMPAPPGVP